jgi:hypothetical protein
MNRRPTAVAAKADGDDATLLAHSLRTDFARLITIFDCRLENASTAGRSVIADARTAAHRGLKLSEDLIELLQKNQLGV